MTFVNRKQILKDVKHTISQEHQEKIDKLYLSLEELRNELGEGYLENPDYKKACEEYKEAWNDSNSWNDSSAKKKKKSIEWKDDKTKLQLRAKKPRREVNWEFARQFSDNKKTVRKNNSSWLLPGSLVVHKDAQHNTMIVVDINHESGIARVLQDGLLTSYRSLSLRPALSEE